MISTQEEFLKGLVDKLGELSKPENSSKQLEEKPFTSYNLDQILKSKRSKDKRPLELEELKEDVRKIKLEIKTLKDENEEIRYKLHQVDKGKTRVIEESSELELATITQIRMHKWYVKIRIEVKDSVAETVALFDSGADLNCIAPGLIHIKHFEKTNERLYAASNTPMKIRYKIPSAHICNKKACIKTSLFLVEDLSQDLILGTPFMIQLYPFVISEHGLITLKFGVENIYNFTERSKRREINEIRQHTLINKQRHKNYLLQEINYLKEESELDKKEIKEKIENLQRELFVEICAELPNAFWNRKHHTIDLPYEPNFDERNINTKARPIQMSQELLEYCKKEISDLESKGLIRKSRSPWSCPAFYGHLEKHLHIVL